MQKINWNILYPYPLTIHIQPHIWNQILNVYWWDYVNMIGASLFHFCIFGYFLPNLENNDLQDFHHKYNNYN